MRRTAGRATDRWPSRSRRCSPLAVLSACSLFSYSPTPLPAPPAAPRRRPRPRRPPHRPPCRNPTASYAPDGALPTPDDLPAGSTMAKIKKRGRLVAGVSADTYLLGSRNPLNGEIEGFDIDMVKAVAKAIFGDENRYQLRVITAAQRIPALQEGEVDIVARNMTINCDRWTQIAFSSEYYRSGQKILVRKGSKATSLADLKGQKVCAPQGHVQHGQPDQARPEGHPGRRGQPHRLPGAVPAGRGRRRSPATTPCWPGWPPRTRTRWCRSRRRSPPSRTGWASTPRTWTSSGSSTPGWPRCAATASGPRSTTAGWPSSLGPAPSPPKAVYGRTP